MNASHIRNTKLAIWLKTASLLFLFVLLPICVYLHQVEIPDSNISCDYQFESESCGYECGFEVHLGMTATTRDSFGLWDNGDGTYAEGANVRDFMRFQMVSTTGNLVNIRIKVDDSFLNGDGIKVAIYSHQGSGAGYPYELVWGDNTGKTVTNGWMTWNTTSTELTADDYYWLAFVLETSEAIRYKLYQGADQHRWKTLAYGNDWPSSLETFGWGSNSTKYVMHAVVEITSEEEANPRRNRIIRQNLRGGNF